MATEERYNVPMKLYVPYDEQVPHATIPKLDALDYPKMPPLGCATPPVAEAACEVDPYDAYRDHVAAEGEKLSASMLGELDRKIMNPETCDRCGIGYRLPSGVCDHCNHKLTIPEAIEIARGGPAPVPLFGGTLKPLVEHVASCKYDPAEAKELIDLAIAAGEVHTNGPDVIINESEAKSIADGERIKRNGEEMEKLFTEFLPRPTDNDFASAIEKTMADVGYKMDPKVEGFTVNPMPTLTPEEMEFHDTVPHDVLNFEHHVSGLPNSNPPAGMPGHVHDYTCDCECDTDCTGDMLIEITGVGDGECDDEGSCWNDVEVVSTSGPDTKKTTVGDVRAAIQPKADRGALLLAILGLLAFGGMAYWAGNITGHREGYDDCSEMLGRMIDKHAANEAATYASTVATIDRFVEGNVLDADVAANMKRAITINRVQRLAAELQSGYPRIEFPKPVPTPTAMPTATPKSLEPEFRPLDKDGEVQ